jgi:hypothetical protein
LHLSAAAARSILRALECAALSRGGVPYRKALGSGVVQMSKKYRKAEAKDWAKQHWHGLCNVIIPSYSTDLKRLNESGIRHDVRRNI